MRLATIRTGGTTRAVRVDGDMLVPQGKIWDSSTPVGPLPVTPDELPGGVRPALDLRLVVDGETMQSSNTSDLLFGPKLTALLTYDDRLAKAAADAGIPVLAPHDA